MHLASNALAGVVPQVSQTLPAEACGFAPDRVAGNLDRRAAARYETAMTRSPPQPPSGRRKTSDGAAARAERLKTALRANLGRRKAQARAKAGTSDGPEETAELRGAGDTGNGRPAAGDAGTDGQG